MSNAKKAALMAIFAAVEEREAATLMLKSPPPWERSKRPIEIDVRLLMQRRRKSA